MKKVLTLILFVLIACSIATAGDYDPYKIDPKFAKDIKPALVALDTASDEGTIRRFLATAKSLSETYPREWRSYYWEAYANMRVAENVMDAVERKKHVDEAERLINRAEMFIKKNSELYLLRTWVLYERMNASSPNIAPKYRPDFNFYMDNAYKMDQSNPRYFYLKGKYALNDTSEAAKKQAVLYFESADRLYNDKLVAERRLGEPTWGKLENTIMLNELLPPVIPVEEEPQPELITKQSMKEAKKGNKEEKKRRKKKGVEIDPNSFPPEMKGAILPESLYEEDNPKRKMMEGFGKVDKDAEGGAPGKPTPKVKKEKQSKADKEAEKEAKKGKKEKEAKPAKKEEKPKKDSKEKKAKKNR